MVIGEAPGKEESIRGLPFVGQSGNLLQQALVDAGLTLQHLYIANTCKHRPPENRTPTAVEMSTCSHLFLKQQIAIIQPKQILCVGKVATQALAELASVEIPTSGLRSYRFVYAVDEIRIPVLSTWHPAYILRNRNKLPELQEDISIALANARLCLDS